MQLRWAKNRESGRRHEQRHGRTGWGVGDLAADALLGQVVHANQLTGELTFTNAATLEVTRVEQQFAQCLPQGCASGLARQQYRSPGSFQ